MTTMNISLPDEMKAFVDAQVADRRYGNASEYMRDLIRRDLAREQFRAVILAGLESGPAVEWTPAYFKGLRAEIRHAEALNAKAAAAPAERKAQDCIREDREGCEEESDLSVKGAMRFLVRPRAGAQITAAIQYDAVTMQAPSAARGFVDELQSAYELIKRNPDAGSPHLEAELGMPGLRSWGLPKYPYLIVYFRHPDFVDVVDVPHTRTNYLAALINHLGSP